MDDTNTFEIEESPRNTSSFERKINDQTSNQNHRHYQNDPSIPAF